MQKHATTQRWLDVVLPETTTLFPTLIHGLVKASRYRYHYDEVELNVLITSFLLHLVLMFEMSYM